MSMRPCEDCFAHSGIEVSVETLKVELTRLEDCVDGLKKFLLATLATAVLSLFGIIAVLLRTA